MIIYEPKPITYIEKKIPDYKQISNPSHAIELTKDYFKAPVERFVVLYVNSHNVPIREIESHGTVDQAFVAVSNILRKALLYHASSILILHQHPSGSVQPSKADVDFTSKLRKACNSMDIRMLDSVIVSGQDLKSYYSFQEEGRL